MLTQVTLKISFPDNFCQGLLPGVSQINAELPQRDESKGIWPALTGDCIVGDSTEPPGAGLWGCLCPEHPQPPVPSLGQGSVPRAPQAPSLKNAIWKIPLPCYVHHRAPLTVAPCHPVPSVSLCLACREAFCPRGKAAPVIKGLHPWFSICLVLALAQSHGPCRGPEATKG